jgi:hypothetical protein
MEGANLFLDPPFVSRICAFNSSGIPFTFRDPFYQLNVVWSTKINFRDRPGKIKIPVINSVYPGKTVFLTYLEGAADKRRYLEGTPGKDSGRKEYLHDKIARIQGGKR